MTRMLAGSALVAALLVAGCSFKTGEDAKETDAKPYVIGMGEIMAANQMRHAKLWFAGSASNWELAQYEVDELKEGFGDVKSFHPTFKRMPTAPLIDEFIAEPLGEVDKAVKDKDRSAFIAGFGDLTEGCNGCHEEVGFGFNVIQRPTAPEYTNQDFAPVKKPG